MEIFVINNVNHGFEDKPDCRVSTNESPRQK